MSSPSMVGMRAGLRNSLEPASPILRLPDELMRFIISIVAEQEPPKCMQGTHNLSTDQINERAATLGFLRLSEVCRRFRVLLCSMPELWATLFCLLPETHTAIVLTRARAAPLKSYIFDMIEWTKSADVAATTAAGRQRLVSLVTEHAERLCSLSTADLRSAQYAQLFSRTLPFLTDIELRHTKMYETDSSLTVSVDAPTLRRARLFIVPWTFDRARFSFRLPSLRSLDMTLLCRSAEEASSMNWVGDLLENSPLIEQLKVVVANNLEPMDWDSIFGSRTIRLLHLRSLTLEGYHGANLATLYTRIRPNRCAYTRINSSFMKTGGVKCEENAYSMLKICGPLLQHRSYDGLLIHLGRFQNGGQVSQVPYLNVTAYSSTPSQFSHDEHENMLTFAALGTSFTFDADSQNYSFIIDAISSVFKHNDTRQLFIDMHHFAEKPEAQMLITRIWEALSKLARSRGGGGPEEVFKTVNFPSRDAILESPAIWSARRAGPQSMEWVKEGRRRSER